jgi:hypothetical protein
VHPGSVDLLRNVIRESWVAFGPDGKAHIAVAREGMAVVAWDNQPRQLRRYGQSPIPISCGAAGRGKMHLILDLPANTQRWSNVGELEEGEEAWIVWLT